MVELREQFVSEHVVDSRSYGYGNSVDYVIIHQTGNANWGADAEMHAKLQSRMNPRLASWHEQVDDKIAIQSFEDGVQCWAATDGRGPGNTRGYHIEICINVDGDYKQAVRNGAERARTKLKEHNLGIDRLKQHNDFYNKNCPAQIRAGKDGIDWNDFVAMVQDGVSDGPTGKIEPNKSKPAKTTKYKGESIVDYLNSIGKDSSFEARKKYAAEYGIKNYKGTASQNLQLLDKMRGGKPAESKPKANLKVDGELGVATTKEWQIAIGTPADGKISGQYRNSSTKPIHSVEYGPAYTGSTLIKAWQRIIGAKPDGFIGPDTIRKSQKYLGTPVDGEIWNPSAMVKELQRRLNAGTLI